MTLRSKTPAAGFAWLSVVLMTLIPTFATAQTPEWADTKLPAREGLVLWLDASSIQAARKAEHQPALASGAAVEIWKDASGKGRDFVQATTGDQPTLVQVGKAWSVRFDGDTDHLRSTSVTGEVHAATVFIVAALHQNLGEFRGLLATNAPGKRDYESGMTVDLGAGATNSFEL